MATYESTQDPTAERERLFALAAALLAVTLWASAFVGIRSAGHHLSPGSLALGRLLVGSVVLAALVMARREALPARGDLLPIALYGILWFGLYSVALNAAERRVDAGTAAMLVNIAPILVALLAGLALHEGFPRQLFVGCAVAFAGTALIAVATSHGGFGMSWGVSLCLFAALAYSVAIIAQKPVLARVSALQITWLGCTIGALACLPFTTSLAHQVSDAPASAIWWTIYLGAVPTAIGFVAWAYALARTPAGRLGSMTYLVTPIAILLAWALLGETPPGLALVGGVLCLAGVGIARRRT